MDVIPQEKFITYESLVQEATYEYHEIVDLKRWKTNTVKYQSQEQLLIPSLINSELQWDNGVY